MATTILLFVSMNLTFYFLFFLHLFCFTISYVIPYSICLWLISLSIMLSGVIYVVTNGKIFPFLWLNNIPCVCMHVHITFPLSTCLKWTLRLFKCLGYYEQCCNKHGSTVIILRSCFHFLQIYTQKWDCWDM